MDFELTPDQQNIREAVLKHCSQFTGLIDVVDLQPRDQACRVHDEGAAPRAPGLFVEHAVRSRDRPVRPVIA